MRPDWRDTARRLAAALVAGAALAMGGTARADAPDGTDATAPLPAERRDAAVPAPSPADCPPTPALPTEDELRALKADARDRGFLWRIVKDDRTSWLYGTIHLGRREWAMPGPTVSQALNAVDTIALELDPLDPAVQAGLARGFAALPRPTLPSALAERLAARARADCLPEAGFAAMPPAVKAMVLTTFAGRRDGFDPGYGIDNLLAAFGHARRLEVVSLETPAVQLTALDMGSDAATVAWVDRSLAEIDRGAATAQLDALGRAWADGRLDAMTPCGGRDCPETGDDAGLRRRVLDDRNPSFAAGIDALHSAGKRVFAAVGSLHMVGPLGLPALLAARGYRVERMIFESP